MIAWVVAMLVAVLGGVLAWQRWSDGSTLDHDQTATMFGIVVGIEVVAAGAGAAVVAWRRRSELTSSWIAFVVGVHLVPLAVSFESPFLYVVAFAVVAVAVAAVPIARSRQLAVSLVTGVGTGSVLFVPAALSLVSRHS